MSLLAFLLAFLVAVDHIVKYRPQGLLFYKNQHHFSIISAVFDIHQNFEKLVRFARNTHHEVIFVSVNGALDKKDYEDLIIVDVDLDLDPEAKAKKTPILSAAYHEGYKKATNNFLLFLNSEIYLHNFDTLDHMANNLVEHQIFTVKETLPYRGKKEGYKLFFDIFRDMAITHGHVNYGFFAVKRSTYELTGSHEQIYEEVADFIRDADRKNLNIIHIDHEQTIVKSDEKRTRNEFIAHWYTALKARKDTYGLRRMLLFMLTLHFFYATLIYDLNWYNPLLFIAFQIMLYVAVRKHSRHHPLQFVLTPFYLLYFDIKLLFGLPRRLFYRRRLKRMQRDMET